MIKRVVSRVRRALDWHEAGARVPAVMEPVQPMCPQPVPFPAVGVGGMDDEDVVRVVLFEYLRTPCQHFQLIERVGRVALVAFQLYGYADPVLPVPLVRIGNGFESAFMRVAFDLSEWIDKMYRLVDRYQRHVGHCGYAYSRPSLPHAIPTMNYSQDIHFYGTRAVSAASLYEGWRPDEWQFFNVQMRLSMAKPDRFLEYESPELQKLWWRAVSINNALRG